jgi:NADPH:quinone reductase-like Zn-dependent oxidoreductase
MLLPVQGWIVDKPSKTALEEMEWRTLDPIDTDTLKPGECILQHLTASCTFADISVIDGTYFRSFPTPLTPGYTLIGRIEHMVAPLDAKYPTGCFSGFKQGDLVGLMCSYGSYKTRSVRSLVDPKQNMVPFRKDCSVSDLVQYSALLLNPTTAYQLIYRTSVSIPKGEGVSVLVHAAAGSVGSALVQILKLDFPHITVYGTCSTSKMEFVRGLGALPIDYRSRSFSDQIMEVSGGIGVDVVFDGNGPESARQSLDVIKRGGRLVMFGFTGAQGSFLSSILSIGRLIMGQYLPWSQYKAEFFGIVLRRESHPQEYVDDVMKLMRNEELKVCIGAVVAREEIKNVLASIKNGQTMGSIVYVIDSELEKSVHSIQQ